ncbi:MAG TPA: hypothetical protein VIJ61_14205, partial [Thermoanaerobaculia bacterium]
MMGVGLVGPALHEIAESPHALGALGRQEEVLEAPQVVGAELIDRDQHHQPWTFRSRARGGG